MLPTDRARTSSRFLQEHSLVLMSSPSVLSLLGKQNAFEKACGQSAVEASSTSCCTLYVLRKQVPTSINKSIPYSFQRKTPTLQAAA